MAPIKLCIRHVPCKILKADFEDIIIAQGLDISRYGVSIPGRVHPRHGRMNNFGFGFVHCQREEDVEAFTLVFQGFHFDGILSKKRLLVEAARSAKGDTQRLVALSAHARNLDVIRKASTHAVLFPRLHEVGGSEWTEQAFVFGQRSLNSYERGTVPEPYEVPPTRLFLASDLSQRRH
eukprot:TRINITY_DN8199_c0_g2_i1.p1 TRINITY_DN8199_c0_g2~~TRINITY_DN8199_c0_g2_i1.p1  ORF type:complete len:178 (-),score=20.43 TRINITY_DN8199_c0_g2_i1:390-923(-)